LLLLYHLYLQVVTSLILWIFVHKVRSSVYIIEGHISKPAVLNSGSDKLHVSSDCEAQAFLAR
jgi:hypothetical protein